MSSDRLNSLVIFLFTHGQFKSIYRLLPLAHPRGTGLMLTSILMLQCHDLIPTFKSCEQQITAKRALQTMNKRRAQLLDYLALLRQSLDSFEIPVSELQIIIYRYLVVELL